MRSSRQTELIYMGYQVHEVCAWLGNSPDVAYRHYLQVLESSQRAELDGDRAALAAQSKSAKSFCNAAGQNTLNAGSCTNGQETQETPEKTRDFRGFGGVNELSRLDSNQENLIQSQVVYR